MIAATLDDRPAVSIPYPSFGRYMYELPLLGNLADWLRRQRAGRYGDLVRKRQLTRQDADRDQLARATIAADWHAAVMDQPTSGIPVSPATRVWCMQQALAAAEAHLRARAGSGKPTRDYVDLRDGIACLLHYERDEALQRLLDVQAHLRGRRGR
jgi:hypothetical protein